MEIGDHLKCCPDCGSALHVWTSIQWYEERETDEDGELCGGSKTDSEEVVAEVSCTKNCGWELLEGLRLENDDTRLILAPAETPAA